MSEYQRVVSTATRTAPRPVAPAALRWGSRIGSWVATHVRAVPQATGTAVRMMETTMSEMDVAGVGGV
jgi:hypothetical protein